MDAASRQAFREYATRVSFNMSLTRNQIYVLRAIRTETARPYRKPEEWYPDRRNIRAEMGYSVSDPDAWVTGVRKLQTMGLVTWHDPALMKPKWSQHVWRLTEAGELACRLLELAGLIPALAANVNKKRKRAA